MAQDYAPDGEDLYADAGAVTPPSEQAEEPAEPAVEEEAETTGANETALLPKAIFMGKDLKPGTRCEIEVVKAHEDEVEVKYIPHGEKKEPMMANRDEAMEEMMG